MQEILHSKTAENYTAIQNFFKSLFIFPIMKGCSFTKALAPTPFQGWAAKSNISSSVESSS